MLLAFALLQSGVLFAAASTSKLGGERDRRKSVSQAVSWRRKPVPLLKGASVKTPWRFGSFSVSEGSLSFGKRTAGLGFGLLGKKHLLVSFVLLKTQLWGERRAAGGGRGAAQGLSSQRLCLGQLSGGAAAAPPQQTPLS